MARKNAAKPKASKTALSPRRSLDQLSVPTGYAELLDEIKGRIRSAQIKAALSVNRELIELYCCIGRDIVQRQEREGWGEASVVDRLASDLQRAFPDMSGFSARNIWRMRAFHLVWTAHTAEVEHRSEKFGNAIVPQPAGQLVRCNRPSSSTAILAQAARELDGLILPQVVAEIPWGHNIALIEKLKDQTQRRWYAEQTTANGWSRSMLTHLIESDLFARQGKAVTNFQRTLPTPQSDLAQQLLKDPYNFDFLTLATDAHEREAEAELMAHIRQLLLELGVGFAFVGQQYPIEVGGEEFVIDLLFYHCRLHCYFVIDLKMRSFEPEHAGKMSFYLSAVDDLLRDPAVEERAEAATKSSHARQSVGRVTNKPTLWRAWLRNATRTGSSPNTPSATSTNRSASPGGKPSSSSPCQKTCAAACRRLKNSKPNCPARPHRRSHQNAGDGGMTEYSEVVTICDLKDARLTRRTP